MLWPVVAICTTAQPAVHSMIAVLSSSAIRVPDHCTS